MADVNVHCDKCGSTVTVSEFVDFESMYCRRCGEKLTRGTDDSAKSRLRIRSQQPEAAPAKPAARRGRRKPAPQPQEPEDQAPPADPRADRQYLPGGQHASATYKRKMRMTHMAASWILFVVLAAAMYLLRYTDTVASPWIDQVFAFGPYLLIALHIIILLQAFADSVFQGILCLLIPLYSLYYLFMVSDNFYLRAVVAGLLVGIGQDSMYFFQEVITHVTNTVTAWIASGG